MPSPTHSSRARAYGGCSAVYGPGLRATGRDGYRLADYMDHVRRMERRFSAPPASSWRVARSHLPDAHLVRALGQAAQARWREPRPLACINALWIWVTFRPGSLWPGCSRSVSGPAKSAVYRARPRSPVTAMSWRIC